jgi:hypothetical protein
MREGASSYIFIHRGFAIKRRKRKCATGLMAEYYIHRFVYKLLHDNPKYKLLRTPEPISFKENEYSMEIIDDGYLILKENYEKLPINCVKLKAELKEFYLDMASYGFFPHDFELYLQCDGRVAMIDFDKFGEWIDDEKLVIDTIDNKYEPEFLICSPLLPSEAVDWVEDIKKCVKVYNREVEAEIK